MTTVVYACDRHPYLSGPGGRPAAAVARPWAEVAVWWNGTRSHRVLCLVDTGADFTVLDTGTAADLGIIPVQLPPRRFQLADGAWAIYGEQSGVQLSFAGTTVTGAVLFGGNGPAILGRDVLLSAPRSLDLGFDSRGWKHT
ncbi:hypothetical protein BJY16_007307 [Actinoplanes octamycinicus]|uniref:Peptidase A2 domain-containing protein n=1 Tax=Actinoplanes octamycinicus TaxID=135948 RepID=A0A7W7H4H9_9ACTN|nr:retropepsin-like aspartic protease [Actinoplanes octamycinicus]MBB4743848.1 hypothetical protein [Actinoplanes octamycinicus]GIE58477.1 hypothetical protein Aoc01nite_38790 [Actinoplanes octamycinicus]